MTTATRARKRSTDEPLPPDLVPVATNGNGSHAPAAPPTVDQTYAVVPVHLIRPNPKNPRSALEDLDGLAESIRAVGVQEPLLVEVVDHVDHPDPGQTYRTYQLLAGHRRLAAAQLAGLDEVPCMVRPQDTTSAAQRMELALVENLQRADLPPLDEARGYAELVALGLSQRVIGERVGRSQSHVSKRLALLDLPSHVQARIVKGTLPLEAAAALVRLTGHPDKLKAAAGQDPSAIASAVESAERDIAFEAKRAELVSVAKAKGWAVVDEPANYWDKRSFKTLATWNGPPDLDLNVTKHQGEPCHAVMITAKRSYHSDKATATSVCTDPARHGPKGDSPLKAKAPTKRVPELSDFERKEREDDKQRKATGRARVAVLAAAVAAHRNTRGPSPAALAMTLRGTIAMAGGEEMRIAAAILGLDAKGPVTWEAVKQAAAGGDHELHRTAFAVALASTEAKLRWTHSRWSWPEVPAYFAYLATLGYEPTPWEREKLAEATAKDGADEG